MPTGNTTLSFGATPVSDASVAVTGQGSIIASSKVEAWILPAVTGTHSPDEHLVESIKVLADQSSIVAGTGFTIRGFNCAQGDVGLTGDFNVGWVWV